MSQKFLKKEHAVNNLKGSAPRINFLKEKLTALLLFVFLVFVVYKCAKYNGDKELKTTVSFDNQEYQKLKNAYRFSEAKSYLDSCESVKMKSDIDSIEKNRLNEVVEILKEKNN